MRAIKLVTNTIDIPFEDEKGKVLFTLHFDRTDENKKRLMKSFEDLDEKMKELTAKKEDEITLDEGVAFLKETTDELLGEGSFEKMYEVNPSFDIVAKYLYLIMIGIKEEFEEEDLKAVESKYLG